MGKKNLLLQTHRLGDLIMTYPLCSWLAQDDADIWLVGEESFFKDLLRLSPKKIFYVPLEAQNELLKENFQDLINLSHSKEAALLAYKIQAQHKIGAILEGDVQRSAAKKEVLGLWQLYRTSLTYNNHYNKFHWADLNALDSISLERIKATKYPVPRTLNKGRIGLFVGASDTSKRPNAQFWADLALSLANKGYQPVFLGGSSPEEVHIAQQAARKAKMPRASLAGRFTLLELITFLQSLDLFITPDTGPMHLAAMQAIPTFNLSLGPVHPWETAPYQPHHYVLRSGVSCSGCWKCTKNTQFCKLAFIPSRIANLVHALLQKKKFPTLPNLSLYKTTRTEQGLYELEYIFGKKPFRELQGDFWRYFFADYIQTHNIESKVHNISLTSSNFSLERKFFTEQLLQTLPKLHAFLQKKHIQLIKEIMFLSKKNSIYSPDAWKEHPPFLRPLTSFIQLMLENHMYSKSIKHTVIELLENFGKNLRV